MYKVWILSLLIAFASVFIFTDSNAMAHESGYIGVNCYAGYPNTSVGWAETDCLGYTSFGTWFQNEDGYWYRYVYGGYYHYWWNIYYSTTERTMGYCWYKSYCVPY